MVAAAADRPQPGGCLKTAVPQGIRTVILPQENERDLEEIPNHVREEMTFHFVAHCDEVLKLALLEAGAVPAARRLVR